MTLDLDSAGRILSMVFESECGNQHPSNIPIFAAFDFETAFPSVIHGWICMVLKWRKLPDDFIKLFLGIYANARAVFTYDGQKHILIQFLSGVLQGCPGSAFLFNNSLDPFLTLFDRNLRNLNKGIIRACADDICSILKSLQGLKALYEVFMRCEALAGLKLKVVKCMLVHLKGPLTAAAKTSASARAAALALSTSPSSRRPRPWRQLVK